MMDSAPILDLLSSRAGTAKALETAIVNGLEVKEVHPTSKENGLHILFRRCVLPLQLYDICSVLVKNGVDVNQRDHRGATPMSLLILHVNHGLRYHPYPLPEIQRLDDLQASTAEIQETVAAIDTQYQKQVYQCLELLLSSGADVNAIPGTVPSLPANTSWVEAYEHKLMQKEKRWNLLGYSTSMEVSTYDIFNPLTSIRYINNLSISPLHLAAWRGDTRCLQLLLRHGADATAIASDPLIKLNYKNTLTKNTDVDEGRRRRISPEERCIEDDRCALHFLYMYCNKPGDLVEATRCLIEAGASIDLLHQGNAPCHMLQPHVFVKRSYHQYLSTAYVLSELRREQHEDDYIQQIAQCLDLLKVEETHPDFLCSMLSQTALQFHRNLSSADESFQRKGHYLVPYTFRLEPITRFFKCMIDGAGSEIDLCGSIGTSLLDTLIRCLSIISLDSCLNPQTAVVECFSTLLEGGAKATTNERGGSPLFWLLKVLHNLLDERFPNVTRFDCYLLVLNLLLLHGGDPNYTCTPGQSFDDPQVRRRPLLRVLEKVPPRLHTPHLGKPMLITRYIEMLLQHRALITDSEGQAAIRHIILFHFWRHQGNEPGSGGQGREDHSRGLFAQFAGLRFSDQPVDLPVLLPAKGRRYINDYELGSHDYEEFSDEQNGADPEPPDHGNPLYGQPKARDAEYQILTMLLAQSSQTFRLHCLDGLAAETSPECEVCEMLKYCTSAPLPLRSYANRAVFDSLGNGGLRKTQDLPIPKIIIGQFRDMTFH